MELFDVLPEDYFEVAWRLGVILRLAVLLHHSRNPSTFPEVGIHFKPHKRSVRLLLPEGWMDGNPLTRADLEEEVVILKSTGIKLRFH
jgi:exopolyphosphatase/guanosine-5'-triphosphate,3'-diphosphate pyrophosphatase